MGNWNFFELRGEKAVPLSSDMVKNELEFALSCAEKSQVPNPKFSQYYVNCACLVISKQDRSLVSLVNFRVQGGNLEYGLCQALHGEESLVAAVSSRIGTCRIDPKKFDVTIAFASKGESGGVSTCCGNCRDIMRDYFPLRTLIFGANPNGGKVTVARLSDLLVDEYAVHHLRFSDMLTRDIERTVKRGLVLRNDIYSPPDIHSRRNYTAMIAGENNFYGAHDVMCDYHPIYAIRDAVRQVRRSGNPQFSYVVVACADDGSGEPPDVMYKDRQHLLELNFQQECVLGHKVDPSVHLIAYEMKDEAVVIKRAWFTTVKEWLPFPFSPENFGPEFVAYAKNNFQKRASL